MKNIIDGLSVNTVVAICVVAMAFLLAAGYDANWLFGRRNRVRTGASASNRAGVETYSRGRNAARVIVGVLAGCVICAGIYSLQTRSACM